MAIDTISRNKMQEKALFCLYDVLTYIDMKEEIDVVDILSGIMETPYGEIDPYLKGIVIFAIKNYATIVEEVDKVMKGWTFARRGRVEQAIYLLAYSQFYGEEKVDKRVAISVALTLTETYGEDKDKKLVNAVLDKVLDDERRK